MKNSKSSTILYLPHGGGPLPLMGDENHIEMLDFLKNIGRETGIPSAIIVISAHWEENETTILSGSHPDLFYDYYGFPEDMYNLHYPVLGNPELAKRVYALLHDKGIKAKLDNTRGFDHGMFVPLKIMYPEGRIPCIQISLVRGLDPTEHIEIGKALNKLKEENILIIGSGFSFHNISEFYSLHEKNINRKNSEFQEWLTNILNNENITNEARENELINWTQGPFARLCHPREEHLVPLHVCYGIAETIPKKVYKLNIMGKDTIAAIW